MTAAALPLFVAVPVLVAGVLTVLGSRRVAVATTALFLTLGTSLGGGIALVTVTRSGPVATGVGLWPVGAGISFVADMLSALMITVTALLTIACTAFVVATGRARSRFFAPLLLLLTAGVNGALLTGDLFTLFVFVEMMLLPSYGLFVLAGRDETTLAQVAGARLYVTLNLLTSTLLLLGIAFVYGTAGTVNLGLLAGAAQRDARVAAAMGVCLLALGVKAALVPVHGWLARAYPTTSPGITALFSGLHTKIAVVAIFRLYAVVFGGDERFLWVGVVICCATMVIGVLGALGSSSTRAVLAFHMASQIGYIVLGVALFTEAGLSAGIFYLLHHMIVKASLFLTTGAVEVRAGTNAIARLSGIARHEPIVAAAFFVGALSLAGIPPFSGFVAKVAMILAALEAHQVAAVVVMIVVSLFTLLSMLKIWAGVFWGDPADTQMGSGTGIADDADVIAELSSGRDADRPHETDGDLPPRIGLALAAPGVLLALVTVLLGLGAQGLLSLTDVAAHGLLDTRAWVEAVTGR